ncbi:MAG TPA: ASCH domain-containing protein [Kofleriaceae bacterium]|nr:ASCH domain-containing protein [Kofleriaceae bacterium]
MMRVLILDRTHGVLCDGDRIPELSVDDLRPLRMVHAAFASRGLALPAPAGSRAGQNGGRDFVFVIDHVPAPTGLAWRRLRDVSGDGAAWQLYVELMLGGWPPPTRSVDVWSFGDQPEMAAQLAHLVACGAKRVTMGWIHANERDGIPRAYEGGISIVTDGFGYPRLALRSTEVRTVPFGEIDVASAAGEGEGDLTYGDWREGRVRYFTAQAAKHELAFDDRALIAVERFEVLHVIGRSDRTA